MADNEGKWYWNLDRHAVEPYEGDKAANRLGPYDTREEAEHALDKVRERNEQWDAEDEE